MAAAVLRGRPGAAHVVLAARSDAPTADVLLVARALIDAGVPPRTVGAALATFGLDRRRLYAAMRRGEQLGPGA
jgi:hypothetical protein